MVLSGQRSPLHLDGSTPLRSADRLRRQREATAVRTLAHCLINFGASVYNKVKADPENFYLVLEPTVTAQLAIGKQYMRDDSIFAVTTYGWGFIEMVYSSRVKINKKNHVIQGLCRLVSHDSFCLLFAFILFPFKLS